MPDHLRVVSGIYDSFGRGDVPAILEKLADNVRWEDWADHSAQRAGVPWLRPLAGRDAVIEFFKEIAGWEFREFRLLSLMADGNQVAAELVIEARMPSGAVLRDEEMHLWTFGDDGKVVRFRHYADTAKHIDAAAVTAQA